MGQRRVPQYITHDMSKQSIWSSVVHHPHENSYERNIELPGFRIFSLLDYESESKKQSVGC